MHGKQIEKTPKVKREEYKLIAILLLLCLFLYSIEISYPTQLILI